MWRLLRPIPAIVMEKFTIDNKIKEAEIKLKFFSLLMFQYGQAWVVPLPVINPPTVLSRGLASRADSFVKPYLLTYNDDGISTKSQNLMQPRGPFYRVDQSLLAILGKSEGFQIPNNREWNTKYGALWWLISVVKQYTGHLGFPLSFAMHMNWTISHWLPSSASFIKLLNV